MSLIQLGLTENPQEHLCLTLRSWRIRDQSDPPESPAGQKITSNHSFRTQRGA